MDQLQRLLLERYPQEKGYAPSVDLAYPEDVYTTSFVLTDKNSCLPAKQSGLTKCSDCAEDVLYIDIHSCVHALNFDKFAQQFDGTKASFKGDKCDYLLYNINEDMERPQIVFCELTCMASQYVEPNSGLYPAGKRAKAYKQIKNTIENLLSVSILDTTILNYPSKMGLFGWREEAETSKADDAVKSMEGFSATPSEENPLLYNSTFIIEHNFTFVQIKHPMHFEWDKEYQ